MCAILKKQVTEINENGLCPEGTFEATIIKIEELLQVTRKNFITGEDRVVDVIQFTFGFRDEKNIKHKITGKEYPISGHVKSGLVSFIKNVTGKTPIDNFDTETLKALKCLITIENKISKMGKEYSTITSATPIPKKVVEQVEVKKNQVQADDEDVPDNCPF